MELDNINQTYSDQYYDCLNLDLLTFNSEESASNEVLTELLESFKEDRDTLYSSKLRFTYNIQQLFYTYRLHKTELMTALFKVSKAGTQSIYAFLYSTFNADSIGIDPTYYCYGGTFISQDGEYRKNFRRYRFFDAILEKYADIFAIVEELVLSKMESGELVFSCELYLPDETAQYKNLLEDFIINKRLAIKFYMMCWISDYHKILHKNIENHINASYQYVMFNIDDVDIYKTVYTQIINLMTANDLVPANKDTDGMLIYNRFLTKITNDLPVQVNYLNSLYTGQKIMPMTSRELDNVGNINYGVWREIYISVLLSQLVVNLISPSFSVFNSWFLISNAHPGLYDNVQQYEKFEQSNVAKNIKTKLRKIDRYNYVDELAEDNQFISKTVQSSPINTKFKGLSNHIKRSIRYAESDIILSRNAMVLHSEYVGRTLLDLTLIIENDSVSESFKRIFTNYDVFAKHLFEFIYAIYCLNTKANLIHGDLHGNNGTIYELFLYDLAPDFDQIKAHDRILYILSGLEDEKPLYYLFKHSGLYSAIIDVSKSIIGDKKEIKKLYGKTNAKEFLRKQNELIVAILADSFPEFINQHRQELLTVLDKQYKQAFKIISAIDVYKICTSIYNIFASFSKNVMKTVDKRAVDLCSKCRLEAETILLNGLKALINDNKPADITWPCLQIIKDNFGDFLFSAQIKDFAKDSDGDYITRIVDVFNYNNPIKYKTTDYDLFPPFLKVDTRLKFKADEAQKKVLANTVENFKWVNRAPDINELIEREDLESYVL